MDIETPVIHMNGTSRKALLEEYRAAFDAVRNAMEKLNNVTVHGRDYYPKGNDAIRTALRQQEDRMDKLRSVRDELQQIAEVIYDQGDRRG